MVPIPTIPLHSPHIMTLRLILADIFTGLGYMNGATDKMSAGAVYSTTVEPIQILSDHHQQHQLQHHHLAVAANSTQAQLAQTQHLVEGGAVLEPAQMAMTTATPILVPSGALETAPIAVLSPNEYAAMNGGVISVGGAPHQTPMEYYQQQPPPDLGANAIMHVADSAAANSVAPLGDSMPLDQLKQMLSTQLDYYFSR